MVVLGGGSFLMSELHQITDNFSEVRVGAPLSPLEKIISVV